MAVSNPTADDREVLGDSADDYLSELELSFALVRWERDQRLRVFGFRHSRPKAHRTLAQRDPECALIRFPR